MIRNKTIKFNMNNPLEQELWEWLQTQPHGFFSEEIKNFLKVRMHFDKESKTPEATWHKEMNDKLTRLQIPWLAELESNKDD